MVNERQLAGDAQRHARVQVSVPMLHLRLSSRVHYIGVQWQRAILDPEPAERRRNEPVRSRGVSSGSQRSQQQAGICLRRHWRLPGLRWS